MNGAAAAPALSGICNNCLSVLECKDAVWAEFNAARLSRFNAAITFIRKDYGKPRAIQVRQKYLPLDVVNFRMEI